MKRFALPIVLFAIGMGLALGLAYVSQAAGSGEDVKKAAISGESRAELFPVNPQPASQTSTLPQAVGKQEITKATKEKDSSSSELNPAERRERLRQAVKTLAPDLLEELQPQKINSLPESRSLLVQLRHDGLESMLARFTKGDWENWPQAGTALRGGPTSARRYVDQISAANSDLGRYLESAAFVLFRLSSSVKQGEVYDAEKDWTSLTSDAESVFSSSPSMHSVRSRLDDSVLRDRTFKLLLARTNAELVMSYAEEHPQDYTKTLPLLLSIAPDAASEEAVSLLADIFGRVALEKDVQERAEVFAILRDSAMVSRFAERFQNIRRVLAELYLVGAMDALDANDLRSATAYYGHSTELEANLRAQEIVQRALLLATQPKLEPAKTAESQTEKAIDKTGTETKPATEKSLVDKLDVKSAINPTKKEPVDHLKKSEQALRELLPQPGRQLQRGVSYVLGTIFILMLLGVAVFVFLYRRGNKSPRVVSIPERQNAPKAAVRMTSPSEMNFEDVRNVANS